MGAPPAPLAHGTPTKFFTHNQPGFPYVRAAPKELTYLDSLADSNRVVRPEM